MFEPIVSQFALNGDSLSFTGTGFETRIHFESLGFIRIDRAVDIESAQDGVHKARLLQVSPGLADLVYVNLTVAGVSFSFAVAYDDALPLIERVNSEMRQLIGEKEDSDKYSLPILVHKCISIPFGRKLDPEESKAIKQKLRALGLGSIPVKGVKI